MIHRYVVFAGDNYYPSGGWNDFQRSFKTLEKAKTFGQRRVTDTPGDDWYHVVDTQDGSIAASGHRCHNPPKGK